MTDNARTPDLLDLLRHTDDYAWPDLPTGHVWGWRSITADHRTRDGYRWPWPGQVAVAPDDGRDLSPDTAPGEPCPSETLGGLCVAKTWRGARSGGTPAHIGLLVAYRPEDVLGEDDDKRRVSRCVLLDVIDITRLGLARANLAGANLAGANLAEANLAEADLRWVDITGANLAGANLAEADLRWVALAGARLAEANLAEAWRWSDDPPILGWTRTDNGTLTRETAE